MSKETKKPGAHHRRDHGILKKSNTTRTGRTKTKKRRWHEGTSPPPGQVAWE